MTAGLGYSQPMWWLRELERIEQIIRESIDTLPTDDLNKAREISHRLWHVVTKETWNRSLQ